MKKFVIVISVLLMILLAGICCAEGTAQPQGNAVEWKKIHYTDESDQYTDQYYLRTVITGQAAAQDGSTQAAYMNAFASEDGFTFALFPEKSQTALHNNGTEDFTCTVNIILESIGLQRDVKIVLPKDSGEWAFLDEDIAGFSLNDLVIMEIRQQGTVYLTIPFIGWNGRTDHVSTTVSFSIHSNGSNFSKLYSSAVANEWKEDVSTSEAQAKAALASGALADSLAPVLNYMEEAANSASAAKPMLTLNLDITLQKNIGTNPKMNIYVDGQKVTTIAEGKTFKKSYSLEYGRHSISIEHDGNVYYYMNTYSFDLVSDNATIKLSVKDQDVRGKYEVSVIQADVTNWKETRK